MKKLKDLEKIDRLKQLLLVHRTEDISKLTFEQRMNFDDAFAQEIVKLFAIPAAVKSLPQDTDACSNDRDKCNCKDWGGCPVD